VFEEQTNDGPQNAANFPSSSAAVINISGFLIGQSGRSRPLLRLVCQGEAKEDAGEVDPALREMTALRQPPFNAFRSLSILERQPLRLSQREPRDIELPNGRVLRVELQRVMPDGRFRVRVSIKRGGDHTAYLPLLQVVTAPGDPFFVAGQAHDGGTLVIGIRLGTS